MSCQRRSSMIVTVADSVDHLICALCLRVYASNPNMILHLSMYFWLRTYSYSGSIQIVFVYLSITILHTHLRLYFPSYCSILSPSAGLACCKPPSLAIRTNLSEPIPFHSSFHSLRAFTISWSNKLGTSIGFEHQ